MLLASCYVWWSQTKSEERRAKDEVRERATLPGSKSSFVSDIEGVTIPGVPKESEDSRTNADFISPPAGRKSDRAMLPSSKIGILPPPQEEDDESEKRRLLPGSKSIDSLLDRKSVDQILDQRQEQEKKDEP
ncbi:hypothetical protein [Luteolibacter flavescens]|uniref:hypothetical protein n=1 Tax=Luteolibacter flavescens TaxID=1859460 RepID=UPI0022236C93|nr:hypothetical protein [Luteolibacter flavescens]